jgi:septal ring factor EnvC (AmiA/AmiB activator)
MNAKRWMLGTAVLVMLVSALVGGIKISEERSRLAGVRSSIAEQEEIRAQTRRERERLQEEIDRVGKETKELPDSLRATATKTVLETSFDLAKAEAVLDQKDLRAEKRLSRFEEQRSESMRRIKRWGAGLVIVEIVLGLGVFMLIRR